MKKCDLVQCQRSSSSRLVLCVSSFGCILSISRAVIHHGRLSLSSAAWYISIFIVCAQRIFKYNDTQYTSLTVDKILNSLVYRTQFYVNLYGSYKLLKTVHFLAHPVHCVCMYACVECVSSGVRFHVSGPSFPEPVGRSLSDQRA